MNRARTWSRRARAARVRWLWCAAWLTWGCLPVEVDRPECFEDEPCAGDGGCVDGRCVLSTARPVAVGLDCLGDAAGACRANLGGRLGTGAGACLVIGPHAMRLRFVDGALLQADRDAPPVVPPIATATVDATLFFQNAQGACGTDVLPDAACVAERGCVLALRRRGVPVNAEGPLALDFAADGCAPEWAEAAPADRCDGQDADCDGRADEDFAIGEGCSVGIGACGRAGLRVCTADGSRARCDGVPGEPIDELPNGRDDDCDGLADEGQPCQPGAVLNCGVAMGACMPGVQTCAAQGDGTTAYGPCLDPHGDPVVLPDARAEACNLVDDDCDGATDEDLRLGDDGPAVGEACPLAQCAQPGRVACVNGAATCAPDGPQPPERCDDVDQDCDGRVDEDFPGLGGVCNAGVGACMRPGVIVCAADGAGVACDAAAADGGSERCGNRLDDDCDGLIDEGFPTLDMPCEAGEGACRVAGRFTCDPLDPTRVACDAVAVMAVPETCNGLDDDCDGLIDETFDLRGDPQHCGRCNSPCELPDAVAGCAEGRCFVAECSIGYDDRDGIAANGCECNPALADLPDPEFVDLDCDGVDGERNEAVFVSPTRGNDQSPGTAEAPVATLGRALALAAPDRRPVLLAVGDYALGEAPVVMPSGVSVHGGYVFEPDGDEWTRVSPDDGVGRTTRLLGGPRVLTYQNLNAPTLLDLVVVQAADAPAGRSSTAIFARGVGDWLTLRQVEVRAGRGGRGRNGTAGERAIDAATPGADGLDGDDDCAGCAGTLFPGPALCDS
ncbi:MAG: DUF1565 domain-containing protein, partial [Myxococcales bacterium]|nr:DUF1565 domain-containing protein [Myxococcales bacterium]